MVDEIRRSVLRFEMKVVDDKMTVTARSFITVDEYLNEVADYLYMKHVVKTRSLKALYWDIDPQLYCRRLRLAVHSNGVKVYFTPVYR